MFVMSEQHEPMIDKPLRVVATSHQPDGVGVAVHFAPDAAFDDLQDLAKLIDGCSAGDLARLLAVAGRVEARQRELVEAFCYVAPEMIPPSIQFEMRNINYFLNGDDA